MTPQKRIISLDTLRGFAIFVMLICNSAPFHWHKDFSFYMRAFISIAAPLFFAVSGLVLGFIYNKNPKDFQKRTLRHGALILLVAVLNDIFIFGIAPFLSFDILYPIGISLLLAPVLTRFPKNMLFVIAITILLFPLYLIFGYNDNVYIINIFDINFNLWNFKFGRTLCVLGEVSEFSITRMLQSWFVDGWYPIFPWVGFYLLSFWIGIHIKSIRSSKIYINNYQIVFSLLIMISGLIYISQSSRMERAGYLELFYPPDFMFIITILMFLYFIISIPERILEHKIFLPFTIFGRSSLPLYIIQNLLIIYFLPVIYKMVDNNYIISFLIFSTIMLVIAILLYLIKRNKFWYKIPYLVRFLLGS